MRFVKTIFGSQYFLCAVLLLALVAKSVAQDKDDMEKKAKEYFKASLAQKYELNKKWAIEEVLPALSGYEMKLEDQFTGVKSFGGLVAATDFSAVQDIDKLTSANPDYWKAVMEMDPQNQLIPVTKMFMLVSQGYLDHAFLYAEMLTPYAGTDNLASRYLKQFYLRMEVFITELTSGIKKGVSEHDKGNYIQALKTYDKVLKSYPYSAWALYENYYSRSTLSIKNGIPDSGQNWDMSKAAIYKSSPLYHMDVRATNSKEGFLLFRRQQIPTLFKFESMWLKDVYVLADIALDLGVYDFAAQLFWISFSHEKYDDVKEKSLYRYLYTLEKLGVPQWKENFPGDFDVIFKSIEEERQKAMVENVGYKYFQKK